MQPSLLLLLQGIINYILTIDCLFINIEHFITHFVIDMSTLSRIRSYHLAVLHDSLTDLTASRYGLESHEICDLTIFDLVWVLGTSMDALGNCSIIDCIPVGYR